MDIIFSSLEFTADLVLRIGSIMLVSLLGIELSIQMGHLKYLTAITKPVARLTRLPSESAISFLAAIGSTVAAHTMTAQFYADGRVTSRVLLATGVLNTVPVHFRKPLAFYLPVIIPLFDLRLCLVYMFAFWLTGLLKLSFAAAMGRGIAPGTIPGDGEEDQIERIEHPEQPRKTIGQMIKSAWLARKKMFIRMVTLLAGMTFFFQVLLQSGMLDWFESVIWPLALIVDLPATVVAPISAYIFSPVMGITLLFSLMDQAGITEYQAMIALLVGGLVTIPVTRFWRTLPRYIAIYGLKFGSALCGINAGIALISWSLTLAGVILCCSH
ncbi:hypothetical protein [Desulfobacula phenolica]|uniref:Nucleoside recognition n=1 Tax=Desulfobacula phenolica TaxID=90732 RepID=A0A1H2K5H2_9BACT|nr:hypothetical protein [Desulfobacula phenolica]SDU63832.1 hypothetical protein SAMN04487931_1219 [Desulfobacula phenolica]